MFYLSSYLEANREKYYIRLQNISSKGNWDGWTEFFLKAITEQAKNNNRKVKEIMGLYDNIKSKIQEITHSQYTIHLLDAVFDRPIFETTDFVNRTKIHKPTAMGLLRQLKGNGILKELRSGSGRRAAVLCFPELLNITESRKIF